MPRLKNFNVAVREWHDQIVFLRKIVEGGTDKSYGIQVARLAGVPKPVLERAKEILRNLEESELTPEGNVRQQPADAAEREKLKKLRRRRRWICLAVEPSCAAAKSYSASRCASCFCSKAGKPSDRTFT